MALLPRSIGTEGLGAVPGQGVVTESVKNQWGSISTVIRSLRRMSEPRHREAGKIVTSDSLSGLMMRCQQERRLVYECLSLRQNLALLCKEMHQMLCSSALIPVPLLV